MTCPYWLNAIAAAALVVVALESLNKMSRNTRWPIRIAYLLLVVGAFAVVVAPAFGGTEPSWVQIASHWGILLLLYADKRRCHWDCTPEKRRESQQ